MAEGKAEKKLNRGGLYRTVQGFLCSVCIACVAAFSGRLVLPVKAEPATLKSSDATVYEQADEGSNPVGNLVEGSSFEYIGDVTAEDGSVWHQITTAGGISGYIRGDREIGPVGGADVPQNEEGENTPPEEDSNTAQSENGGLEESGPEADGNTGEEINEDGGEEDTEPEGDEEEDSEITGDDVAAALSYGVENLRTKNYTLETSGRIKEAEGSVAAMGETAGKGKKNRLTVNVDTTLILSVLVLLFSGGTAYLFLRKVKRIRTWEEEKQPLAVGGSRPRRKNEKKKRSQKRKSRKSR